MMGLLVILSAKGGSGTSLLATNLGICLSERGPTLLIDLHDLVGGDDLLLDLEFGNTWSDLVPVADELQDQHLSKTIVQHSSGLFFLGSPKDPTRIKSTQAITTLLKKLSSQYNWVIVDPPAGLHPFTLSALAASPNALLVLNLDPPSLRAARQMLTALHPVWNGSIGLVANQIDPRHPANAEAVAEAMKLRLFGKLPTDRRAIGYQIHFGNPAFYSERSPYKRAVQRVADHLIRFEGVPTL